MKLLTNAKQTSAKAFSWFARLSKRNKIIVITVGIVIAFILGQRIQSLTKQPSFTTAKVEKSDLTEVVTESGNITASGRIDVYSPTDGIVTESYVANGDMVLEGDSLFKVESSATDQQAQQAYSNYLAAVTNMNAAQATANTLRALMYTEWKTFRDMATNSTYEKGDDTPNVENRQAAEFQIAQDEWLAAEKKYKDQQTAIAQTQAQVASTWSLYQATQDAVVTAPISGLVSNLAVNTGSTVGVKTVTLTGGFSTPALVLSDNTTGEVLVTISETDISKIRQGQRAVIKVNAIDDKEYKAIVERVDSIGTNTNGVITYNVYLNLLNNDNDIRQGMTIDADITTKTLKNVLTVPNSSVKPYRGGKAVRVPDNTKKEKFRYVPVVTGVRGNTKTQILRGLNVGDIVITTVGNDQIKRSGLFGS